MAELDDRRATGGRLEVESKASSLVHVWRAAHVFLQPAAGRGAAVQRECVNDAQAADRGEEVFDLAHPWGGGYAGGGEVIGGGVVDGTKTEARGRGRRGQFAAEAACFPDCGRFDEFFVVVDG